MLELFTVTFWGIALTLEEVKGFNSPLSEVTVVREALGAIAQCFRSYVIIKKELKVRVSNLIAHSLFRLP